MPARRFWLSRFLPSAGLAVLALAAPIGGLPDAAAQDVELQPGPVEPATTPPQQFGAWFVACEVPSAEGAPQRCRAYQNLELPNGETVLHISVNKLPDTGSPVAVLILPLGIALPPGVSIAIDNGPKTALAVERCVPAGCRLQFPLTETSLATLQNGQQAVVGFADANGRPVGVPVSLDGFDAAYAALP